MQNKLGHALIQQAMKTSHVSLYQTSYKQHSDKQIHTVQDQNIMLIVLKLKQTTTIYTEFHQEND